MNLKWRHNHPVTSADVLRRRDVSPAVADKFKELFAAGHSPSSALETHKRDLQLDDKDSYTVKAADRFHCPDLQWCYRLYYKLLKAEYVDCGRDDVPDDSFGGLNDDDGPAVEPAVGVVTDTQQDRQMSCTSATGVDYSGEQVEEAATQLGRMTATLTDKLRQDPATYLDSVVSFVRNFDNVTTTSGLMSAMHCFGRNSGAATALAVGRKRKAAVAFANKRIDVQPTAVARRSVKCFGRRMAGRGRPSKLTRSSEHSYSKVGAHPVSAGLPPRKTAASHNLQECVSRRVSLGK